MTPDVMLVCEEKVGHTQLMFQNHRLSGKFRNKRYLLISSEYFPSGQSFLLDGREFTGENSALPASSEVLASWLILLCEVCNDGHTIAK